MTIESAGEAAAAEIGITWRNVAHDGRWHDVPASGKDTRNTAGRIRIYADEEGGQVWNWTTAESLYFWVKGEVDLDPAARDARRKKIEVQRAVDEADRLKLAMEAESKTKALWKAGQPSTDNHYLTHKRVEPVDSLKQIDAAAAAKIIGYAPKGRGDALTGFFLVVPIKTGDKLTTCQLIDGKGRKHFLYGGALRGGYWSTGKLPEGDGTGLTFCIAEGVATALSIFMATGHLTVAAMSCGNFRAVAVHLRHCYPAARLIVCSDKGNGDADARRAATEARALLAIPVIDGDGSDYNDLYGAAGRDEVKRQIETATAPLLTPSPANDIPSESKQGGQFWPEPLPIETKISLEPYPLDALPETIRLAVDEVLGFVKAPAPLVIAAALSALSMAIQAHADVERAVKLSGPTSLFLLTIAESGERKSTCDGFFTSAIRDYEADQAEAAKPDLMRYEAELTAWEAKHSGVKDSIRQAAKNGEATADKEADLLRLQGEKPQPPKVPRIIYGDATPEALKYSLAKQWPSGAVVSSEAGVVFGSHGMGKDSAMRNLATLNQLWDGTDMPTERRASESFTVKGARLTMSLMVQEATLRAFFKQDGGLARGTGFLARFLIAWPESTQGFRPYTEAPENWPHLAAFNRRIAEILKQAAPITEEGALTPAMLPLSPEAKEAWIDFHDAIESELATGGELFDIRDVASKTADNAARLACLFQVFNHGGGAIALDAIESAGMITAWHLNEARRFFGGLTLPQELADAARLDSWMIGYCQREKTTTVPISKIQQYGPCGLRVKVAIDDAVKELEGLDRARPIKDGKRRSIQINPKLLIGES